MRTLLLLLIAVVSPGCIHWSHMPKEVHARAERDVPLRLLPWRGGQLEMFEAQSAGTSEFSPRAFVLTFCPGNAADMARTVASRWDERPVRVWAVNYPGYGQSTGKRTLQTLEEASLDVADVMRRVAGGRAIFVEGDGLSAVPALHIAAERKVEGLILLNTQPPQAAKRRSWWDPSRYAVLAVWRSSGEKEPVAAMPPSTRDAVIVSDASDRFEIEQLRRQVAGIYTGKSGKKNRAAAPGDAKPLPDAEQRELNEAMDWLIQRTGR